MNEGLTLEVKGGVKGRLGTFSVQKSLTHYCLLICFYFSLMSYKL